MSDRRYSAQTGYPSANGTQSAYNTAQSRQFPDYPAPSQTSPKRSPPRKPVNTYETNPTASDGFAPPPPPPHRNSASTPARYRQHRTSRDQNDFGMASANGTYAGAPAYNTPQGSGVQPYRDVDTSYGSRNITPSPDFDSESYEAGYAPQRRSHPHTNSQHSMAPLSSNAAGMPTRDSQSRGIPAPGMMAFGYGYDSGMPSPRSERYDAFVDPRDIADDVDDGFDDRPSSRRNQYAAGAGAGAGASALPSMLRSFGSRETSGGYGSVPGGKHADSEKSEWLRKNGGGGNKKLKYIFGGLGILIIIGIIAGVVGGILATNPPSSGSGGSSSSSSSAPSLSSSGNKYNINSPEVQALLGNKNLHKVFPSIDYTPLNAQYPDCLKNPPIQDNVTLDVAMLSQLTPAIRLYGTDCDQIDMTLTAIEKLKMTDTLKVWLGVWLDSNSTSNDRQMNAMYDLLDKYPQDRFAGVIIGNEVLFREDMTESELGKVLATARSKIKAKGIDLPVSTSDLGDNWTSSLAADSDIVMANVHPFFAGVKPDAAPGWTWSFWTTHDVILAKGNGQSYPKSIISETGWPSQGGNDCGTGAKCPTKTDGAIAGISEMNEYLEGWVCPSMANGTTYFWFEAFDEPWKEEFDTPSTGDYWEPHWGLMDVNRNLKDGVKIPDCGGKTLDKPY